MYIPLYNESERKHLFRISVSKLCVITVSLPLFAFIICVMMTMYKDFENANFTHCNVPNVFPSISASIGNYEPQNTIWKTAIYTHAPMRFFIIYLRWEYYRNVISEYLDIVIRLAVFLNIIENLALIGLTHWTSSVYYPYHEFCFKTFIGTSVFYMLFTCMMLTKYRRKSHVTSTEKQSVKMKWRAFIVNISSFARLHVVAAYKGLAKEKEALEVSLKALNKTESTSEGVTDDSVAALTESLSTLTAEKSRMEEAFQADKKVTREKYENMIYTLREETKAMIQQHQAEVNNLKAKIAYEIQERENERADHAAMLKELHIKINTERKSKEKLEDKVGLSTEAQSSQAELEKRVRDLSSSLEAAQRRLQRAEARTVETPALLVRLQNKLALVEQSHSVAIREKSLNKKVRLTTRN
ncbi:hypothetical protein MSG28_006097 [Choristoneura fumiferana]|uniref:Uncharacterized protein n=1 Tax=Choristoneura fumiferana TaxID=7141 RepID=A0ACC0JDT4_CHOFU|nr:hypothetical protein MSG28_006097 [Choristoneura fumiferana]